MLSKLHSRINTYSLMTIVLFFSYIYDSLRNTYLGSFAASGGSAEAVGSPISGPAARAARRMSLIEDEDSASSREAKKHRQEDSGKHNNDCPLAEMPTLLRLYSYFSTLAHIFITSKYILLSMVKYRFVNLSEQLACYLPGRVSFLDDLAYELPGLAIMMSGSHLVWRSLWYLIYRELSLESLIFIVCDDEFIRKRRNELRRKFATPLSGWQRERLYQSNRMFCQRIQLATTSSSSSSSSSTDCGRRREPEYLLRRDRDLTRKRRLDDLVRSITVVMLMNTICFGTPLAYVMLLNIMSHDYFHINYQECVSFSSAALAADSGGGGVANTTAAHSIGQQLWSFSDPFRVVMFLADSFDNFMIIFDSASGLTWPLVTSVIVALDLDISMDEILHRIGDIIKGLHEDRAHNKPRSLEQQRRMMAQPTSVRSIALSESRPRGPHQVCRHRHRHRHRQLHQHQHQQMDANETEILILQSDILIVFDNVRKIDRYINAFAAYAIIFWVTINVTYEVLYVSRRQEYSLNFTAALIQVAALILLTFAFAHLGRTHNKTVRLYHGCCNLMAQDPHTRTSKQSWIWLLEYYHHRRSLYSLHMGWTVLTFSNYIKFMLYSITFSMVLINLLQQELY